MKIGGEQFSIRKFTFDDMGAGGIRFIFDVAPKSGADPPTWASHILDIGCFPKCGPRLLSVI